MNTWIQLLNEIIQKSSWNFVTLNGQWSILHVHCVPPVVYLHWTVGNPNGELIRTVGIDRHGCDRTRSPDYDITLGNQINFRSHVFSVEFFSLRTVPTVMRMTVKDDLRSGPKIVHRYNYTFAWLLNRSPELFRPPHNLGRYEARME